MKAISYRNAFTSAIAWLLVALSLSVGALSARPVSVAASGASSLMLTSAQDDATPSATGQVEQGVEVLPMSMRPLYHVYAAFGLAWLLIFGYAVSLRRRMTALEREVEQLGS
jgi:CcmD family protein